MSIRNARPLHSTQAAMSGLRTVALWWAVALVALPTLAVAGSDATAGVSATTDRLIVRYRQVSEATVMDAAALATVRTAASRHGVQVLPLKPTVGGAHVLHLDRHVSLDQARQLSRDMAAADAKIAYAEPDRRLTVQFVPNDSQYAKQWALAAAQVEPAGLNLAAAWEASTGVGVTVAVIDTGYRPHADLAANLVGGYDFISNPSIASDGTGRDVSALDPGDAAAAGDCGAGTPATPSSWHGTHVAGIVAAVTGNALGIAGVAPGAKVLPVRALGKCGGYTSDIADAIVWASGGAVGGVPANPHPARVINLSFGGSGACDLTTQHAINVARSRGAVVVAAAGNFHANAADFTPASCAGVISVAAVGRTGGKAPYSNVGTTVDIAAPGGDFSQGAASGILSTLNAGATTPGADNYGYFQGTSSAAPHVSGVVALMLSQHPTLTPDEVKASLKASARAFPAPCAQCGAGIVNARAAVDAVTLRLIPVDEHPSANDTQATAQAITPAQALVHGAISAATDTDYFKVTIGAGKRLTADLTAASAVVDFDLYAHNAAGATLASSIHSAGHTDTVVLSNTSAVPLVIYVRVVRWSGTGAYTLKLVQ